MYTFGRIMRIVLIVAVLALVLALIAPPVFGWVSRQFRATQVVTALTPTPRVKVVPTAVPTEAPVPTKALEPTEVQEPVATVAQALSKPTAVPVPANADEWFKALKVEKRPDGSCFSLPDYVWWVQDRAWNSGDKDPVLGFEVPYGQIAMIWGTTLVVDGSDASGSKVTKVGVGKHNLTNWTWGTTLRGTDSWGYVERWQAAMNACAFGGSWTWQSK